MSLVAAQAEFWADFQVDLYTNNTAFYLANQRLETLISQNGKKAHRPILSHPVTGTYTPHSDITYGEKSAEDQYLEVDTYRYAADDVDDTESASTPYNLVAHSSESIRRGLKNIVEQEFLSEITNARHSIQNSPVLVTKTNISDLVEEADGVLGAFDAPMETAMKAAVFGPKTIAKMRNSRADRETGLGDTVSQNGIVGPWLGWTFVQSNNLPWSANLNIATNPTDGDTVTISGVTFTFKASPTTAGHVDIGSDAAESRANLKKAVEGGAGAGTTYIELSLENQFLLRRKRYVRCDTSQNMAFTGFGDISVSETLTAAADIWSNQKQTSTFMIRGSIDVVIQLMKLEIERKEKGFADLVKGMIGIGTKTFNDGATMMVKLEQDASGF